jgi:hypothetical protein
MSRNLILDSARSSPGLRVALNVKSVQDVTLDDAVAIHVDVVDAARPLRISVYLDGDLVDTWVPAMNTYELRLPNVRGRHVITARAMDGHGRWGGASTLVNLGAA